MFVFQLFLVVTTAVEALVIFTFSVVPAAISDCSEMPEINSTFIDASPSTYKLDCDLRLQESQNRVFWIYTTVRILFT